MLIPSVFDATYNCANSYAQFYEKYSTHIDTVCFKAAVFVKLLAYMCTKFGMVINVNIWDKKQPKFLLNLKLQYHNTMWTRIIEIMAMTHFFYGIHSRFIKSSK